MFPKINLTLVLLFLVMVNGCSETAFAQDKIRINFNGKTFVKDYPKSFDESIKVIHEIEGLLVDFSDAIDDIDSVNTRTVTIVDTSTRNIVKYTDSISHLVKNIDSLNTVIKNEEVSFKHDIDSQVTEVKESIKKLPLKPLINVGIGIGYDMGVRNGTHVDDEISLLPSLYFRKVVIGLHAGMCMRDPTTIYPRFGGSIGFTLK